MNGKKVGIMTWYQYRNYGSALQATALYSSVEKLGYAPQMINYTPKGDAVTHTGCSAYLKKLTGALKRKLNPSYKSAARDELYTAYLAERITETSPCPTHSALQALEGELDAFVCGSDQIWSPLVYDPHYFLDFVRNPGRMVAYAPSIGSDRIADADIRCKMAAHIARFQHLSVREERGVEIIRELCGKQAVHVLDPTFLLNAAEWDDYAKVNDALLDGDYIFCYFLGDDKQYRRYVDELSRQTGWPVMMVPVTKAQSKNAPPFEIGPSEFVSLIKNAKAVCTDSFHGMAFAIQYNTPFFVFKRFKDTDPRNQNSRVLSLLNMLGLQDRLIDPTGHPHAALLTVDFAACNRRLAEARESSRRYLATALEQAVCAADTQPYGITGVCCGCGACAAVCKTGAVTVSLNSEGFYHYAIDQDKCVHCGQCRNVCPFVSTSGKDLHDTSALYSAKSCRPETLKISSSGGLVHEALCLLAEQGRPICGCVYDSETRTARHKIIAPDDAEGLARLQGSKYIQSKTVDVLEEFCELTRQQPTVFVGTPCQTAAVNTLLCRKGLRQNAVLIDLICHGVPSAHLWGKYLQTLRTRYDIGDTPAVLFRDKQKGWRKRTITVAGNGKFVHTNETDDDFYAFFRRSLTDMESCFECVYREASGADIRAGDYWGERFVADKEGVSMVLAVTEAGQEIMQALAADGRCCVESHPLTEYWTVQYPYNHPRPVFRETLIGKLADPATSLPAVRKDYCAVYDLREAVTKKLRFIKKLLRRG